MTISYNLKYLNTKQGEDSDKLAGHQKTAS